MNIREISPSTRLHLGPSFRFRSIDSKGNPLNSIARLFRVDGSMSHIAELLGIADKSMPFPPRVITGYGRVQQVFSSGDLAKACGISPSTAKFYLKKMVDLKMVTKIPNKKKYQKYANARIFSDWLKDLIRIVIVPLERGEIEIAKSR